MNKYLIVGSGRYDFYEVAVYNALLKMGYNTELFAWRSITDPKSKETIVNLIRKLEARSTINVFHNREVNRQLSEKIKQYNPNYIFFYNTRIIHPSICEQIRTAGAKIICFSNDNPFSNIYPKYWWKKYKMIARKADLVYAYRESNILDYKNIGCQNVKLLLPYYIEEKNFPICEQDKIQGLPDVVFIGHYEPDGRDRMVNQLTENNVSVGVPSNTVKHYENNGYLYSIENSFKDYNRIIASAKICLVFLSRKNYDTYTRRCFEIPAARTLMLSVYTEDLANMFKEDQEAVYFRSSDELLEKVQYYLSHEDERNRIAENGYKRLMHDGHEVKDRVKQIIEDCSGLR